MMAMIGGIMRGKEPNVSVSLSKGWELGTPWNARMDRSVVPFGSQENDQLKTHDRVRKQKLSL